MNKDTSRKPIEPGIFQGTSEAKAGSSDQAPRIIRTMKSDMEDAVRNQKETAVSIAIAEEKKQKKEQEKKAEVLKQTSAQGTAPAPKPIKRIFIVLTALLATALLVLAGIFILPKLKAIKLPSISLPSFDFFSSPTVPQKGSPTTLAPSIIPAQSEKLLDLTNQTRAQIFEEIIKERSFSIPQNSIKNIHITESNGGVPSVISANRLLLLSDVSIPEMLARSLDKAFMIGLFGENGSNPTPFLVLKVSGYETGLAGMLEWEKTLPSFFNTVFGTKTASNANQTLKFHDTLILQKDARELTTLSGDTIVYSFANTNTIVIAGNRAALEALIPLAVKN